MGVKANKDPKHEKPSIYAYGFDQLGFSAKTPFIDHEQFKITFVPYREEKSLEDADGVIMPSGIFEQPDGRHSISCDRDMLAERQRQINIAGRNQWLCFLLGEVNNGSGHEWSDTDYAKLCLNGYFYEVLSHNPYPHVKCRSDEFRDYITRFGIARTSFRSLKRYDTDSVHIIADHGNHTVAGVVNGWLYLLPLPSGRAIPVDLADVVTLAAASIITYKARNEIHLPVWVAQLRFQTEVQLEKQITQLHSEIVNLQQQLEPWGAYKAILCTTGDNLVVTVVKMLREYFGLDVNSEEAFVEDAIVRINNQPAYVLEIKGVNAGVKRDHINQVDSHRERRSLDESVPGLLIINDFMNIEGVAAREAKPVDEQILNRARNINVKIIRAITLFQIMKITESIDMKSRRTYLLKCWEDADPLVAIPASQ